MRTALLLLALLPLASCGGGGAADPKALTDSGWAALSSNDHAKAVEDLQAALDAIGDDHAHAQYERARTGLINANAYVNPDVAKEQFLAMAAEADLDANQYSNLGGLLADASNFMQALDVLHEGLKKHEGHAGLTGLLDRIKTESESDPALQSALQDLGYL